MCEGNLIGKCGLYCGACVIYRAERDNQEWRGKIADSYKCDIEQVRCNGCGDLSSECWGNECKIVLCTRAKGVNYCSECQEYISDSCNKFKDLCNDYLEAGVNLRDNLVHIQEGRAEEWLQESQRKFACKACGKPLVVWTKKCHHCGVEISK